MKKNKDLIYGLRPVIEALKSGKELEKIFVQKGLRNPLFYEIRQLLVNTNVALQYVPVEKLNRMIRDNHQGIIAFASLIAYQNIENIIPMIYEDGRTPFILVLDQITDVRNVGAIARTAECAGVDAIIVPAKGSAQINADAMKTSAGALNNIPVCRVDSLVNTVKFLKDSGIQVIAASEKANKRYSEIDYSLPLALIMGSEESGISPALLRMADELIQIPLYGKTDSLNVSVASGIIIFEAIKHRNPSNE